MKNLKHKSLEIKIEKDENLVTMSWIGQSDEKNPSSILTPYLESCVDFLQGKELTIEFDGLDYINSSTVSPIIEFLKKLNAAGIPTCVTYNKNATWQNTSFRALKSFTKMLPLLTVKGR